jgi:hypothetical protein
MMHEASCVCGARGRLNSIKAFSIGSNDGTAARGPYALTFLVSTGLETVKLQQLHSDDQILMLEALAALPRLLSLDMP